jgi:hypothetical protein
LGRFCRVHLLLAEAVALSHESLGLVAGLRQAGAFAGCQIDQERELLPERVDCAVEGLLILG